MRRVTSHGFLLISILCDVITSLPRPWLTYYASDPIEGEQMCYTYVCESCEVAKRLSLTCPIKGTITDTSRIPELNDAQRYTRLTLDYAGAAGLTASMIPETWSKYKEHWEMLIFISATNISADVTRALWQMMKYSGDLSLRGGFVQLPTETLRPKLQTLWLEGVRTRWTSSRPGKRWLDDLLELNTEEVQVAGRSPIINLDDIGPLRDKNSLLHLAGRSIICDDTARGIRDLASLWGTPSITIKLNEAEPVCEDGRPWNYKPTKASMKTTTVTTTTTTTKRSLRFVNLTTVPRNNAISTMNSTQEDQDTDVTTHSLEISLPGNANGMWLLFIILVLSLGT